MTNWRLKYSQFIWHHGGFSKIFGLFRLHFRLFQIYFYPIQVQNMRLEFDTNLILYIHKKYQKKSWIFFKSDNLLFILDAFDDYFFDSIFFYQLVSEELKRFPASHTKYRIQCPLFSVIDFLMFTWEDADQKCNQFFFNCNRSLKGSKCQRLECLLYIFNYPALQSDK